MNRLALLLPLLAVAACRDNRASVQIQAICAVSDSCTFSGKCDTVILGNPAMDPSATQVLSLPLQVENQLPDNGNKDTNRLNTNDAHLDEAVIDYEGALSGRVIVAVQGYVPAAGTTVISVDVIPAGFGATLTGATAPAYSLVTAKLKLRGYYDDGSRFETGEFPIPVEVSTGAVAGCTAGKLACPNAGQYPHGCKSP